MKNKTCCFVFGCALILTLSAVDARDKDAAATTTSRATNVQARSSVVQRPSRVSAPRVGSPKVEARGSTSNWSGSRGGGGHYSGGYHQGYHHHGYYGWGSYYPYWSIGAFVPYLPDDYTTIYVDGNPYFYGDGYYFSPYSNGYVVVPEPASAAPQVQEPPEESSLSSAPTTSITSQSTSTDTIAIGIPNSKGGFTSVRLVKHKNGYIGPQGEFYAGHPTLGQLKVLYGD